jgi:hypothetical protein
MDWKDYVIIGGALFIMFGGGVYTHYKRKGRGQVAQEPSGGMLIDDLRRMGTAVASVGGRAFAEGGKLARSGAMAYVDRSTRKQLHNVGSA